MITSWFSQSILWGISKVMRHYVETGQGALRRVEPHGDRHAISRRRHGRAVHADPLDARVRRAASSVPTRWRWIARSPSEKLLLVPALNPDVALIHVQRCDAYGNAQIDGCRSWTSTRDGRQPGDPDDGAVVSNDQIRRAPDQHQDPVLRVDAVVELPFGCAPHECYGVYEPMMRHMQYYVGW
jgi:glutaconate CoA-transferase subunit A